MAMKWRRSWSRNERSPAPRTARWKVLVTQFGFHACTPLLSLANTNPSRSSPPTMAVIRRAWSGEDLDGRRVEFDGVAAFGLGVGEHRASWSFDPAVGEGHLAVGEVDIAPTQPE